MLDVSADQRFAKLLVERGKLRDADMTRALRVQEGQASRERLSRLIVRLGLISERDAADTLSEILDFPLVHGADYPEANVFDGQVSARFLKENVAVPIAEQDDGIVVAMADPQDDYGASSVAAAFDRPVVRRVGAPSEIDAAIER